MNRRNITQSIIDALGDTPVVFLRGARQTGKTTLVKGLGAEALSRRNYVTLDSASMLAVCRHDPVGFLRGLEKPLTLDEVQRVPELMLAIKEDVDNDRISGRYLLTGSANILSLPETVDSLAGRMEVFTLFPMSQGEIGGIKEDFISRIFERDFTFKTPLGKHTTKTAKELITDICAGGYPEILSRKNEKRRGAWFDSYITLIMERDLRDISKLQDVGAMVRLLTVFAARTATLFNQSEMSRIAGIPNSTLSRYIAMLEALFLIHFIPAWSPNLGKRLVKSPKVHVVDSALAAHLCGAGEKRLAREPMLAGRFLESFVVMEILKQLGWTDHPARLYHYRSHAGEEVDLLLEDRIGNVAAIEIKLSESISRNDMKCLINLRDTLGDSFARGVILYGGNEVIPIGDRLEALPVSVVFR